MNVKPMKQYKKPDYPYISEVSNHPEILQKIPVRWQNNRYIKMAVTGIAFSILTGCAQPQSTAGVMPVPLISEASAFEIIAETAKKEGLDFKQSNMEKTFEIPLVKYDSGSTSDVLEKIKTKLDGQDDKKKIGFEYISSSEDLNQLSGNNNINYTVSKDANKWVEKANAIL